MAAVFDEGKHTHDPHERLAAAIDGAFVVFLIGPRTSKPWLVHKWLPGLSAMPRMLSELQRHPEMGFLHAESWLGRTAIMVQYWHSIEQLHAYAHDGMAALLPAWRRFNRAVGTDGSAGSYESIHVNMPPFGLGRAAGPGQRLDATRRVPHGATPGCGLDTEGVTARVPGINGEPPASARTRTICGTPTPAKSLSRLFSHLTNAATCRLEIIL